MKSRLVKISEKGKEILADNAASLRLLNTIISKNDELMKGETVKVDDTGYSVKVIPLQK